MINDANTTNNKNIFFSKVLEQHFKGCHKKKTNDIKAKSVKSQRNSDGEISEKSETPNQIRSESNLTKKKTKHYW